MPSQMELDVAIIGGGPGGLAAALALSRAVKGARIKVFERARKYRPLGAGVGMDVNGMKAIEAIDPALEQYLATQGKSVGRGVTYDHEGNEMKSETYDPNEMLKKWGKKVAILGWYEIQTAFYRALPPDTVVFNSRFESYEEDADGVTVHFAGEELGPIRAKILIGADGYFSAVRQQCLQDGPPNFAGTVCWRARLETEQPLEQSSWFFGAEKVALLYPISDHHMVWTASAPIRLVEEAGVKFDPSNGGRFRASTQAVEGNDTALERCLKVFEGYPPSFLEVLQRTNPRTVAEHGIFTRQAEALPADGWGRGRVTLVGDAAHPVRPTGQGLNMTMEDAAELAWFVQQYGLTPEALRSFEKERIPRVSVIVRKAQQQGEAAYNKDAKDATTANRRIALEQEYTVFKNSKQFRPLVPLPAVQLNGHAKAGVPSFNGQLEGVGKGSEEYGRRVWGVEKRHVLLAGAALVCSLGVSVLARAINA